MVQPRASHCKPPATGRQIICGGAFVSPCLQDAIDARGVPDVRMLTAAAGFPQRNNPWRLGVFRMRPRVGYEWEPAPLRRPRAEEVAVRKHVAAGFTGSHALQEVWARQGRRGRSSARCPTEHRAPAGAPARGQVLVAS